MVSNRDLLFIIKARDDATKQTRAAGRGFRELGKESKIVNDNFKKVNKSLGGMGKAARVAQGALATLGVGFGLAIAIKTIAQFEDRMAAVNAVTGATEEQFKSLRDTARTLGATTRFTASQAAAGMEFLARAGFEANEIISAMPDTLNLAAAASLDLGRAADIMSNVMQAFKIPAENASLAADLLAKTAASANTNVEQLGQAMKFVGPVASNFGVSIQETAAFISVLSDAGLQAGLAGTGLRRIISELSAPSSKLRKRLKDLNITLNDVNPAAKGLELALRNLIQAGFSAADAMEIFGQRAGPAFLEVSSSIDKITEANERLSDFAGTAQEMADIMNNNIQGAFRNFASAVEGAILLLGDAGLTGSMRGVIETMTGVIRALSDMTDPLDKNTERFEELAGTVATVSKILGALIIAKVVKDLVLMTQATLVATNAWRLAGFAFRLTPFGLIVSGLALAGTALALFSDDTDAAAQSQRDLADAIRDTATARAEVDRLEFKAPDKLTEKDKERLKAAREILEDIGRATDEFLAAETEFARLRAGGLSLDPGQRAFQESPRAQNIQPGRLLSAADEVHLEERLVAAQRVIKAQDRLDALLTAGATGDGADDDNPPSRFGDPNAELKAQRQKLDILINRLSLERELIGVSKERAAQIKFERKLEAQDIRDPDFVAEAEDAFDRNEELKREAASIKRAEGLDLETEANKRRTAAQALSRIERTEALAVIKAELKAAKARQDLTPLEIEAIKDKARSEAELAAAKRESAKADRQADAHEKIIREAKIESEALREIAQLNKDLAVTTIEGARALAVQTAEIRANATMLKKTGQPATEEYIKAMKELAGATFDVAEAQKKAREEIKKTSGTFVEGARKALDEYAKAAANAAEAGEKAFTESFDRLEDAIVDFVTTGKLEVGDLANFIQTEITRAIVRATITGPLAKSLSEGSAGGGGILGLISSFLGFGGAGSSAGFGALFDLGGSTGFDSITQGVGVAALLEQGSFAEGGVMTPKGMMALKSYATGGVATSPQLAVFAEGDDNEAFVPLPDGKRIPVAFEGGGPVNDNQPIIINFNIETRDADSFKESQTQIMSTAQSALLRANRRNT